MINLFETKKLCVKKLAVMQVSETNDDFFIFTSKFYTKSFYFASVLQFPSADSWGDQIYTGLLIKLQQKFMFSMKIFIVGQI